MNPYNQIFTTIQQWSDDDEFHEIKPTAKRASGWCEDFIPPRLTREARARWLLCKSLTGHRFDYLHQVMGETTWVS